MRVYIAAPLFNEMEKCCNERINGLLKELGVDTYLPQKDGGEISNMIKQGGNVEEVSNYIFNLDVSEVRKCDLLLFLLDGRVPDEGSCFELGLAYALGKKCIGFKTDIRSFSDGYDNLMIRKSLADILHSELELKDYFKNYKEK